MATLIDRRGRWYARIRWYLPGGKRTEKQVPLKTSSESIAFERLIEVNKVEKRIKKGMKLEFPWQNKDGQVKVVKYTLSQAVIENMEFQRINGIRESTIERDRQCFNNAKKALGNNYPIADITSNDFERIKYYFNSTISNVTIDMVLIRLKRLLNWCRDVKEIITKVPKMKGIKIHPKRPSYLTESDFAEIMKLHWLKPFYKEVFLMYSETGMRLREVFNGKLEGSWLVLMPDDNKTGITHEIPLKKHHIDVIMKMRKKLSESTASYKSATDHYSKVFKKALIAIGRGELRFHNLRDTYAVRAYLKSKDLYMISKILGHTNVTTTQKYASFNLMKLKNDFPSLASNYSNMTDSIAPVGYTEMGDTSQLKTTAFEEKLA